MFARALAAVLVASSAQASSPIDQPMAKAKRLLDQVEYEAALVALADARKVASNPHEEARVRLYQGICHAGLMEWPAMVEHFRAALELWPEAELPEEVGSAATESFARLRAEMRPRLQPEVDSSIARRFQRPKWPLVVAGAGAAAALGGGFCALQAKARYDKLTFSPSLSDAESEAAKNEGTRYQALAIAGIGAGVAALGAGLGLYLFGEPRARWSIAPASGGAVLSVSGALW